MTTTETKSQTASFEFCESAGRRGTNFLHHKLVAEALKLSLPEPPAPRFTEAEVRAGFTRGEQLFWLPSKDAEGTPITMQGLYGVFDNKAPLGGNLLRSTDWYEHEPVFTEDTSRVDETEFGSWRLIGAPAIPGTKGENYLRQTVIAAAYVRDTVYKGEYPSESLRAMLAEPAEREEELAALVDRDWKKGAEILAGLAFNKEFRMTPIEALISVIVNQHVNKIHVLTGESAWTPCRFRNGNLVLFGNAGENGADLDDWPPRRSYDHLGFFLSCSDSVGRES